jgi:uncharacterized protein YciI
MGEGVDPAGAVLSGALAAVRAGIHALLDADLARVDAVQLAGTVQVLEVRLRRFAAVDARLLGELDTRGVAGEFGACSTLELLRDRLPIPAARAKARLAAAGDTGPRRTLTGQPLPARNRLLADAQATGTLDPQAARLIRRCLDRLPADLPARHGPHPEIQLERLLVHAASRIDARTLAAVIERLRGLLDPDGHAPRDEAIRQRRFLQLSTRPDGTAQLAGELTREASATLAAVLDPLCAPDPAADGTPDPRTAAQRCHDALLDACTRLLTAGTLPDAGGVPATILLTIDATDLAAALTAATSGPASEHHTQQRPTSDADPGKPTGSRSPREAASQPPGRTFPPPDWASRPSAWSSA